MPAGRPTKYTKLLAKGICLRLMLGESLTSICKMGRYPSKVTVLSWLQKYPEFLNQYTQARQIQQEMNLEKLNEFTEEFVGEDNGVMVQRDRLRADTLKWIMERMSPKKYMPQSKIDHTSSDNSMSPKETTIKAEISPQDAAAAYRELMQQDDNK